MSLAGYSAIAQLLGRELPIAVLGVLLGGAMLPLLLLRSSPPDAGALVGAVLSTVLIAGPLGLAIGALFARELEGMLALIAVGGIAMSVPPELSGAMAMPLWGPVQLIAIATDAAPPSYSGPLLHALVSVAVLSTLTWFAWRRRIRVYTTQLEASSRQPP